MFNNIKSGIRDIFGLSNKAVLDEIVLTLYRLNPCRKPEGQRLCGHVYIKGVTVRFGFDAVRTSQLPTDCQKQSNGNASWGVFYTAVLASDGSAVLLPRGRIVYLHWRGAFGVARFDNQGNAKAFMAWNEWQDRLHAFRIYKRVDFVNEGVSWLHLLTELEWTFYETIHIAY